MDDQIKIVIRRPTLEDKDFVMATWLNGCRYGSPYFELQDAGVYYKEHAEKVKKSLLIPGVLAPVACDESNPKWIVGFAVFDSESIYWVYVRKGYRKKGIAKLLLGDREFKKVRGLTKIGAAIAKMRGYTFEPI